jgi:uncharacterized protein DUF1573
LDFNPQFLGGNVVNPRGFIALASLIALFAGPALAKDDPIKSALSYPKLVMASAEHDFGKVQAGPPLEYRFQLKNAGQGNLVISKVKPACGCTTAQFDSLIAPGKTGSLALIIKSTKGYKGSMQKTATVITNDPDHTKFLLILRAEFEESK